MMRRSLFPVVVFLGLTATVSAGGWNNTLMGSRAVAMGAAFIAVADDPSAVYYNPAGLPFLEQRFSLSLNGFSVRPLHNYTGPQGNTLESRHDVAFPQVFFAYRSSERLTLAFGFYVPYAGGGVDWEANQPQTLVKSSLGIAAFTPALAYRINDRVSVGVYLNLYRGKLDFSSQGFPYGTLEVEESGSAVTAGASVLVRMSEKLQFGLNVRGPARMTLHGNTHMPLMLPEFGQVRLRFDSETRFDLPWDVEAGAAFRISDRLQMSVSAQYTMWTALDMVEKTVTGIPEIDRIVEKEVLDFQNILIVRAGAEYRLPGGLVLRGGFGVDRAASPLETLSLTNIDVDKATFLGGLGYRTGSTEINFVFVRAFGRERERTSNPQGMSFMESFNLDASIWGLGVTFGF